MRNISSSVGVVSYQCVNCKDCIISLNKIRIAILIIDRVAPQAGIGWRTRVKSCAGQRSVKVSTPDAHALFRNASSNCDRRTRGVSWSRIEPFADMLAKYIQIAVDFDQER